MKKFEFVLYINNNIICQRFFSIKNFNPKKHVRPNPDEIDAAKKANGGKLPTEKDATPKADTKVTKQQQVKPTAIGVSDAEKRKSEKSKKVKKINDSIRKKDNFNKDKSMAIGLEEAESQKRLKANKVKKINNKQCNKLNMLTNKYKKKCNKIKS